MNLVIRTLGTVKDAKFTVDQAQAVMRATLELMDLAEKSSQSAPTGTMDILTGDLAEEDE